MSDLKTLLATQPETLAGVQYCALRDHVVKQLSDMIAMLNNNELVALEKLTFHSSSGDECGQDNRCINFAPDGMGWPRWTLDLSWTA